MHENILSNAVDNLKSINLKLWEIEDGKRLAEKKNDFGKKFSLTTL